MVIFSMCKVARQGHSFKSASEPKPPHHPLSILLALILVGCATDSTDAVTRRQVLQQWTEITGSQSTSLPQSLSAQMNSPDEDCIAPSRPTATSARGNDIYLQDAELRRIFHYGNFKQTLKPFATTLSVETGMRIYAAPDMSVYVTDPAHARVLDFNWDGILLPSLVSRGNMASPVGVVVDEHNGQIFGADGLFNSIIVFDSLGMALSTFKMQQVLSIASMATGPDGVYVVDGLAKQIVVLGWDDIFHYTFGAYALSESRAIAVSRDNLVFISDNFNNKIRDYRRQRAEGNNLMIIDKFGGIWVAPGSFNSIGGLAAADDHLFMSRTALMNEYRL